MMEWQVTATTIRCQKVNELATIMVKPDGTVGCAFVNRQSRLKGGRKRLRGCSWPNCPAASEFRDKALSL